MAGSLARSVAGIRISIAIVDARGVTGNPDRTVGQFSRGSVYSYRVDARFDDARGTGERVEVRPCTLTFVK